MNDSCRASYNCEGQVAFVFRLPAGQVEFSGLFLTLALYLHMQIVKIFQRCEVQIQFVKFVNVGPPTALTNFS